MQVARNFFLTPEKTYVRKIKEILLAIKIDHELPKEKILELYLNKIFFGHRAYGVAAAAQVYYGKELNELTLPEMAMLAGIPQAPSRLNPISNPKDSLVRRNHVLARMLENDYIDKQAYEAAIKVQNTAKFHAPKTEIYAPYVAEMIRDMLVKSNGPEVYSKGLYVYLTVDSHLQEAANDALRQGLMAYDQRHGYRGSEDELGPLKKPEDMDEALDRLQLIPDVADLNLLSSLTVEATLCK